MGLLKTLTDWVDDPRRAQGLRTNLPQMFSIIIISNLCGHFGGRSVAKFGKHHESTFKEVLDLKHRVPSHVTFSDILNRVDENQVIAAFNEWANEYVPLEKGELVSGDGKALGSTVTNATNGNQKFTAIVSLFCQKSGLVHSLKQYVNAKKSEINIVRFLIKELEAKGLTLFFDALHIQKETAEVIVDSENHYVLQVKRNQPSLFDEIQRAIVEQKPLSSFEIAEKDHGRYSHWYVSVYNALQSCKNPEWKGLTRFIHVHKNTVKSGKDIHSDRFYISSNPTTCAEFYHQGIRGHWSIENSLHYVKDVIHREDNNQIKKDNGPVNTAVFSSIAINIHRKNGNQSISLGQMKFSSNVKELFQHLDQTA